MSEITWKLERFSDRKQREKIIDLRKIVFTGEDTDKENTDFWDWEFRDNYAGKADLFLALDGDQVVGHYAVCPSRILVNGEVKTGSIVVDVMTHPDYRFQGMFTKLGRYSLEKAGEDGIDFSYGFPIRKTVMPGHLKVGWKVAFPLPVYVFPVSFPRIIQKFVRLKWLSYLLGVLPQLVYGILIQIKSCRASKNIKIREAKQFDDTEELRKFVERTKKQHRIMQCRDYSFLKWRYNENRYRDYKIFFAYNAADEMIGYVVLRKTEIFGLQCITIIDIQTLECDRKAIRALLWQTYNYAKAQGVSLTGCMINKNGYKRCLLSNLFIKSPYIFKFILHKNKEIGYGDELMKNENWFITWADTDDL